MNAHVDVTAYHEAGHAVMALYCNKWVHGAAVSQKAPGNGLVAMKPYPPHPAIGAITPGNISAAWERSLRRYTNEIRICLAGPLAEAILLKTPIRSLGASSDFLKAQRIANRLDILHDELNNYTPLSWPRRKDYLPYIRRSTRAIMSRPIIWMIINSVAGYLSRWHYISSKELAILIQKSMGNSRQLELNDIFTSTLDIAGDSKGDQDVSWKQEADLRLGRAA